MRGKWRQQCHPLLILILRDPARLGCSAGVGFQTESVKCSGVASLHPGKPLSHPGHGWQRHMRLAALAVALVCRTTAHYTIVVVGYQQSRGTEQSCRN